MKCPVCHSNNIREKESGEWFCHECMQVTYISKEATEKIPEDFDIEDYLPEDD